MSGLTSVRAPAYRGQPPETWERIAAAYRGWWQRHLSLARGLARLIWALYLIAIPLLLLALLVVPRLWVALVPGLVLMVNLGTMALLARTRTIAWRSMTVAYSVGGLGLPDRDGDDGGGGAGGPVR